MPRVADSRIIGILPLQHHYDSSWDEDLRASLFAVRVEKRFDKPGEASELGWWKNAERGVGDIHGGQLFKLKKGERDVSMFRFAWPVVLEKGKGKTGSFRNDTPTMGIKPMSPDPVPGSGGGGPAEFTPADVPGEMEAPGGSGKPGETSADGKDEKD